MFKIVFNNLMKGHLPTDDDKLNINKRILDNEETHQLGLLNKPQLDKVDIEDLDMILRICNTVYNSSDIFILNDDVYDLLLEKYKIYNPDNYQVGSQEISYIAKDKNNSSSKEGLKVFMRRLDRAQEEKMLFKEELAYPFKPSEKILNYKTFMKRDVGYISKRNTNIAHNYPKLVGTLDKVKFVLNSQAIEKGVFTDSNVKVLERDFFQYHVQQGILDPNRIIRVLLELKKDGISVEGDVGTSVISARSRGDTANDKATDLTPILKGYRFVNAPLELYNQPMGMKFEAVITKTDLNEFNRRKNYSYKNCRTGVIGLFSGSDAHENQDLITLIPLATSLEGVFKDRVEEIDFLNKYYANKVPLKYAVIEGNLVSILFQIKRFVEEAEAMRPYLDFMYDGVVVSYLDQDIIDKLPRVNSVNKHTIAVKFNPEKAQSVIRGLTITIGQDGVATPMIHYDPISFFGTVHTKSSIHSYDRYKQLGFRYGNIADFEYVNDVMPYCTKPDNHFNAEIDKNNSSIPFPEVCPECGTKLIESKSGKNMVCTNIKCKGRSRSRIVNMLDKLNLKDFAEATIEKINIYSLSQLLQLTYEDILAFGIGEVNSKKFIDRMNYIKTEPIYDYDILGALGFDNIAKEKWKKVMSIYTLDELINMDEHQRYSAVAEIKGLGPETARIINERFEFFQEDLNTILSLKNVVSSKGIRLPKVRLTGFRDKDFIEQVSKLGFDIGEGSVTKDTDILLVPSLNHSSPKIDKAKEYGTVVMTKGEFKEQYNL